MKFKISMQKYFILFLMSAHFTIRTKRKYFAWYSTCDKSLKKEILKHGKISVKFRSKGFSLAKRKRKITIFRVGGKRIQIKSNQVNQNQTLRSLLV